MPINFKSPGKYLQHFLTTVIALSFTVFTIAQVKFSTVVNERQPGINDYIQVEYTIENAKSVEKLESPSFKNLRLIQGPMQSNGMTYVNGAMSQYKSVSFILQPLIKGKIIIPGGVAIADGKTMRSEAITINVQSEGASGNNNKSNNNSLFPGMSPVFPEERPTVEEEYTLRPGESVADKIKKNLFVKADINKTTCYEGEPIMATFKLCSRLKSESRVLKRPSLNGFSVYDMVNPEANRPSVQTINGRPYNVHLIRQTQLIPLQSGTFIIDPVELDNKVTFIKQTSIKDKSSGNRMQQLMDEFMNDGVRGEMEEHSFTLSSKPVTITVKPLPVTNKPASFNGAVGKFTMVATCKNKTVAAGEQIALLLTINGAGNLTVINPPTLTLPDSMEAFDPVTKEKIDKSIYPLSGSKTFTYNFVARDTGNYQLPAIVFSYFNPAENAYKTLRSDSFPIHVTPAVKKKGNQLFSSLNRKSTEGSNWFDAADVNILIGILTILLASVLAVFQWKKFRSQQAKKISMVTQAPLLIMEPVDAETDPLEGARQQLLQASSNDFYKEINRSVWKIMAEKMNVPPTELNKYNMISRIQLKGADSGLVYRLQSLLNECEIALYTPMHTTTDMEQTLQKAASVIKDVQDSFT